MTRDTRIFVQTILVLLVIGLVVIGSSRPKRFTYERLQSQTVVVLCGRGLSAGVFISPRYEVLTAAHAVRGGSKIVVVYKTPENLYVSVRYGIEKISQKFDLAVIGPLHSHRFIIDKNPVKVSSREPKVGDIVILCGHPIGLEWTVTRGNVTALGRHRHTFQSDAVSNPGNSGGPAVNERGELIGVLVGGMGPMPFNFYQGQVFIVAERTVREFLGI
jgi:S1-C subfamily serine protease